MAAKVSIVITTYNRDRYLGAAIASVLRQTYTEFELLVWVDGSTDRSIEVAHYYAACDERVRVVAAKHWGRSMALMAAIAHTSGEYVGWVDDDDLLSATALQETVAVLDAEPEIGLVYTDYIDTSEDNRVLRYGKRCQIPYSPKRILVDFMTFHFRLMRRSLYDRVGGIDPAFEVAEDYDLCLRLSEATEFWHIHRPLYYYRNHPNNSSYRHHPKQLEFSRKAIAQALQRRGLANEWDVVVRDGRFFLQQKPGIRSRGDRWIASSELGTPPAPVTEADSTALVSPFLTEGEPGMKFPKLSPLRGAGFLL